MLSSGGRTCVLVFLLWLGFSATGGYAQDTLNQPLRAVRFSSNAWIDERGLRELLPLRVGQPVTAVAVAEMRRRLELTDIFEAIDIEPIAEGDGVLVLVHLRRKPIITSVDFRDHEHLEQRELQRLARLRPGTLMEPHLIDGARERIRKRYVDMGYTSAQAETDVETRSGEAEVTFIIAEGKPLIISAVLVTGDTGMPPAELEDTLADFVGKPRSREAPRHAKRTLLQQLRQDDYYQARVESKWAPVEAHRGDLLFMVDAGPRFVIAISGNPKKSPTELLGLMDLPNCLIITNGTWRELARRMTRHYQEAGFYRAEVTVTITDADPRHVDFTVKEGRRYKIRTLTFQGNRHISSEDLAEQMVTQPARRLPWPRSGILVDQVFDNELERLRSYYHAQGFASAIIVDVHRAVDEATDTIDLTVLIDEGPQTVVREIRPEDLAGLIGSDLDLKIRVEGPFVADDVKADRLSILNTLKRAGYRAAQVESHVERHTEGNDKIAATVDWTIIRGPRQQIGAVIVQGNVETRNEVILRELPFTSGEPLDTGALLKGQDNVYRLGLFRSVSIAPIAPDKETDAPVRNVRVSVVGRPPGRFKWGVGYNSRDGFVSFLETRYENLGRMGRRLSLRGQVSIDPTDVNDSQYLVNLGFRERRVGGSPWQLDSALVAVRTTQTIRQFNTQRLSLNNTFSRELWPRVRGGGELQVEWTNPFDVRPIAFREEDTETAHTIALSPFLVYDGRDDPFLPRQRTFDSVRLKYALPGISSVQFPKINFQHTHFIPLFDKLTFVYSARAGWEYAISDATVVPIRERFFVGGATTVRGFTENSIGLARRVRQHHRWGLRHHPECRASVPSRVRLWWRGVCRWRQLVFGPVRLAVPEGAEHQRRRR